MKRDKQKRSVGLSLRITPDEYAALERSAEAAERTVSDQARQLIKQGLSSVAQRTTSSISKLSATIESDLARRRQIEALRAEFREDGMRSG